MSYHMRDRADGQIEIIFLRPTLIGIFPDRDLARRVCILLEADDEGIRDDDDAAPTEADTAPETASERAPETPVALPVPVAPRPTSPARLPPAPPVELSEEQREAAFARIIDGEKIARIAPDFGLSMGQLRGMWAHHCRTAQRHIAEAGPQECRLCGKTFTPSVTNPDTCARCSHG
ncbi:hypothetical protein RGUI_2745 [Rhodovulum sp. P5]|uniref:hypothetical protein n=1 Tax=Rhodovulum sp. P5 TaxID=1564506 RepID=UPI0009C34AE8|nr:hypothetical protein [Rhodovulum sp. P5]ARE40886.1 hypothetical protein RGUI_2745 [Rhodovulum sp. P5]